MPKSRVVLVIEDDEDLRILLVRALTRAGFGVLAAEDGESGLGLVEKADVLLLNLKLPKMSGEELLRVIRNRGNYIPVIIISGADHAPSAMARLSDLKVVDFFEKPFSLDALMGKVGKANGVVEDMQFVDEATTRLKGFIQRQAEG